MLRALSLCALLAAAFQATVTQLGPPPAGSVPAPTGSAAITGVVIDAQTNAPIADVMVSLDTGGAPAGGLQTRQLTDSKGRFAFVNLPASDNYTVAATKPGYLDAGYTRLDAFSTLIAVRDGEWFSAAKVAMYRPGTISGTVIDEHGEPLAGVFVRVLAQQRIAGRVQLVSGPLLTTDDRGMYRAAGLLPGKYLVEVPNVSSTVPAATTPGVISGVAFWSNVNSQSTGRPAAAVPIETALDLDPRARLMVGRYATPPPPAGGQPMGYSIAFHPNAPTVALANAIDLQRGEQRSGADVRLEPVPVSRVSGMVQGPADVLPNLTFRLVPAGLEDLGFGSESGTALVAPDGSFVFLNVPAGTYLIDAPLSMNQFSFGPSSFADGPQFPAWPGSNGSGLSSGSVPSAPPGTTFNRSTNRSGPGAHYWARQPVTVSGRDESNVVVTMRAGVTATGRILLDADANQATTKPPTSYTVAFDPATGSAHLGMPQRLRSPDSPLDEFEVVDLMFGQYFLRVTPYPVGWIVKSISWNGRDYTGAPFDTTSASAFDNIVVTVTNAAPVVSGTVTDGQGTPAATGTVIAFPADPALWTNYGLAPTRIKPVGVSNTGAYRLATLPAGEYFLIALSGAQPMAWQDPEFFKKASALATRVSVGWSDKKSVDLKVTEVR